MWQVFLNDFQINDQLIGMHLDEPIEGLAGLPAIRTSQGTNLGRNGGWTTKQLYEARLFRLAGGFSAGRYVKLRSGGVSLPRF